MPQHRCDIFYPVPKFRELLALCPRIRHAKRPAIRAGQENATATAEAEEEVENDDSLLL